MSIEKAWENAPQRLNQLKEMTQPKSSFEPKLKESFSESFLDHFKQNIAAAETVGVNRQNLDPKTPADINARNLTGHQIGDSGTIELSEGLGNKKENALFLSDNQIGDLGATSLANALKSNTSVEHLILSNNKITDFAAAALADLLKVNHHIGWLVLSKNAIGTFGATCLADGLSENKGVKYLVLAENNIEDPGVRALCGSLEKHPKIEGIFLQGNPIKERGIDSLESLSRRSKSLRLIDIRDINFRFKKSDLDRIDNLSTSQNVRIYT